MTTADADRSLYRFEDHPDHEAQLPAWRDKWIANAFSTRPVRTSAPACYVIRRQREQADQIRMVAD